MAPITIQEVEIKGDTSMIRLRAKAVEIALAEQKKQVAEVGMENRGPVVDKYLIAAGVPQKTMENDTDQGAKDRQWCGMFVYWCYLEAAKQLKLALPFGPTDLWSGKSMVDWSLRHSDDVVDVDGGTPLEAGDIFTVKPPGHIGLIVGELDASGSVPTVEGNQSEMASKWNGIAKKTIKPSSCHTVVRL